MSKNPLLQTLIQMTGQKNVITIHRPFVEFTGSLEAAMMLGQLLYWTPKSSMSGWIAKSDSDWQDELFLSRHSVRSATNILDGMGLVETKLKKFNGAPTKHYKVKWEILESKWLDYLNLNNGLSENRQSDYSESDNGLSENDKSLTEITAEITKDSIDWKKRKKEAEERIAAQRAKKKDPVDWLVGNAAKIQAIESMRRRVEKALNKNLERYWDATNSDWNGYDKELIEREKETGETIEMFMDWFNEDEFRRNNQRIWLKPAKIEELWPAAFSPDSDSGSDEPANRLETL